jgi:L-amino acid N-acyltransferase YncA
MNHQIKQATQQDIEQILKICSSNLYKNNKEQSIQKLQDFGFLIAEYTLHQWQETISDKDSLTLVYKEKDDVVGYLNGFNIKKAETVVQNNILSLPELADINIEKIFYYRQIAKKSNTKCHNIGKDLVLTMIDEISKRGYQTIVCQIIHAPIKNSISINFHIKLGFKCIAETYENNYLRGIYLFQY